jgi:hypothetical protein
MNKQRVSIMFVCLVALMALCTTNSVTVSQPATKVIFEDHFKKAIQQWQQVSGIWQLEKGVLRQTTDDPAQLNTIRFIQSPRFGDGIIEASVAVTPRLPQVLTTAGADDELTRNIRFICGAGIIFRMKDPRNYYMFRLAGEEGVVLGKMVAGEWTDLANPRFRDLGSGTQRIQFGKGNYYKLKVECRSNRIMCYVNDGIACTMQDASFDMGQVGLVTFKTAADFSYIKVLEFTH